MKRFYNNVETRPDEQGSLLIFLDARPVRTSAGQNLLANSVSLAEAIRQEWEAQGETIDLETMPLNRFQSVCIDRIAPDRGRAAEKIMSYLDTDLLCYRTGMPGAFAEFQRALWDTALQWFEDRCGVRLEVTTALKALRQPDEARNAVRDILEKAADEQLTVIHEITIATGSLVLGLGLTENAMTPEDVFNAALAEENYKAQVYNEDVHGRAPHQEQKESALKRDLEAARRYLDLAAQ